MARRAAPASSEPVGGSIVGWRDTRRSSGLALIVVLAFAFVAIVALVWSSADRHLREREIAAERTEVERVLDNDLGYIEQWASDLIADVRYWATDPAVVASAVELSETERSDLVGASAQAVVRDRLVGFLELNELAGYFIVAPDGLSLASSRDSNIGTENLVALDHPEAFADILGGASRVTPPQLSDVPLADDGRITETMFIGAPIVVDGEVVAAFLLRVVPSAGLTPFFDPTPIEGFGRLVFCDDGNAVTGLGDIAPLDGVVIDGRPATAAFDGGGRGINLSPGADTEVEQIEAWATSPELGLGVYAVYEGDAAFSGLRAERRGYLVVAILVAVGGLLLGAVALWLVARARERQLSASTARFRSLVDPSPDAVFRASPDGRLVAANAALYRLLDPDPEVEHHDRPDVAEQLRNGESVTIDELGGRHPVLHEIAVRWSVVAATFEPTQVERINAVDGDLRDRYYRVRFVPIATRQGDAEILVVITDVTADVERELHLESLALIDSLTGLCNRASITDRLGHALDRLTRPMISDGVAVIVVDLDHFKPINDAFGHSAGDQVLIAAGATLSSVLRDHDSLGRVGGDEFILVCEQVADLEVAEQLASRVSERLASVMVEVDGSEISISGSVGVAWTREPVDSAELIARADRAMLSAKHGGDGGFAVSQADSESRALAASVGRDLFGALDRREFELHYQPIVEADGTIVAAEALLRWNHPQHGLLGPGAFLPSLMQSGFIGSVGRWVVRESIAQAARWRDEGHPISVNVNVSPVELSTGVVDVVGAEIDRHGLDPRMICVEITEDAFAPNGVTSDLVAQLGDLGVRIALDDFGTGSSTLAHLRQRPLHYLKLDRGFVANIDATEPGADLDVSIVRAIIGLADDLHLDIVAEGVETLCQLEWLIEAGCTKFQGWAFGAAVSVSEFRPEQQLVAEDVAVRS